MIEVTIENITFPPRDVEKIVVIRGKYIEIILSDVSVGKRHDQFLKWIDICGTMHNTDIQRLRIGDSSFKIPMHFTCNPSIGIIGVKADRIDIKLEFM